MAKPEHYQHSIQKVSDLIPYVNNSRTHSDEQVNQVASSIKEFGFTSPVLIDESGGIIAGHGRVMAAKKLNLEEVPCITLEGLTDAQRKAYIITDNQLALNSGWDLETLNLEIETLNEFDFNLDLLGFDDDFLSELVDIDNVNGSANEDESPYTHNIEAPTYEPRGEKPDVNEIFDEAKSNELLSQIETSNIPEDVKQFLRCAAYRHAVINYEQVADFYSHSEPLIQRLFEDSALVIIDFNKAIEDGYVKLNDNLKALYKSEKIDNE
tara:strand:+ start:3831 stop:4631 length:801 start_codon:yes stop_codon:yes gene_type:complete